MTDTFTQAVQFVINRETVNSTVSPRTHLADFLRVQQMLCGTNIGCEQGVCGACTVMIDGVPARSCITPAIACAGSIVQSIEGFDDDATMNADDDRVRLELSGNLCRCTGYEGIVRAIRRVLDAQREQTAAPIARATAAATA